MFNPLNEVLEVRVLDSTYCPYSDTEKLIGKILEVKSIDYKEEDIRIFNEDKSHYYRFNFSDVQLLLPKEFTVNGRRLGYGDKINGSEIIGINLWTNDIVCRADENTKTSYYLSSLYKNSITPIKSFDTLDGKDCELEVDGKVYKAKLSIKK